LIDLHRTRGRSETPNISIPSASESGKGATA
jgi:hypothetical protein